jgi:hypothetical protein
MRLLASIATVAIALAMAMAGCGGDDNGDTGAAPTIEGDATEASVSTTTGKGGAAPAETPEALASCLEEAGLAPTVLPPPPQGEPGSEYGTVGSVRVDVGADNGVVAIFFDGAKRAESFGRSPLGKQSANSAIVGAAFLTATTGTPEEYGEFRTCLEG